MAPAIAPASPSLPKQKSFSQPATNSASVTTNAQPLEGGEIIARVDGQIVLASDVLWQVNKIVEANRDRIPPQEIDNVRKMLLRQQLMGLIDTKLLYADFRRTVPAENIPNVEENLAKPFEEHEVPRLIKVLEVNDRRELAAALTELGTSISDLQRQFGERTIAGEWLRQRAPNPKPATHDEMLEYYQEHKKDYDYPSQARWEELMIRFDRHQGNRAAAWQDIAKLGNTLWQRVVANPNLRGPVFSKMSKEHSHGFTAKKGGVHDWTTKGALRNKAVDQALFSLEVGQLSNIIETEQGFHIVRVLERKEAGRTPFTEAQAEIRKQLESGRKEKLVRAELAKLRKQSRVWTVFDGDLPGPRLAELLDQPQRR